MIAVLVLLVVLTIVPAVLLALLGNRVFPQRTPAAEVAHARVAARQATSGPTPVRGMGQGTAPAAGRTEGRTSLV